MSLFAWLREIGLRLLSTLGLYNKKGTVVLLAGLDNSGKSTLLHRLSQGQVTALQPTERPHIDEFQLGGVSFKAWDLGGHEAVRYLWFDFLSDSHAIVFMVDSADGERLEEAHWELSEMLSDANLDGVPVAVLYNKSDLPDAWPAEKLEGMLDLARLEARRPIKTFVTSVLRGEGYPDAFRWLGTHL
ncbi:unnamed protein product [Ectocarpus sp. 12 AP-2014]